jgi:trk system potassium uptake protein TrkH
VNFFILLRSLGIMVLLLGGMMAGSVGMSAVIPSGESHNTGLDVHGWAISLGLTLFMGIGFLCSSARLAKKSKRGDLMRRKEAMALVGVGWLVCSLVTALPYLFCEPNVAIHVAVFEATSGLTTTGATIFADVEALPKSILMWRSATQWLGGMGILAIFVIVLSGSGTSGRMLVGSESSLAGSDLASLRQTMKRMWLLYLGFTVVSALALWATGLTPFQAVNHALTLVSTAGFGTENDSVTGFGTGTKVVMLIFMLICGVSFPLYLSMFRKSWRNLWRRFEEVWWFFGILGTGLLSLVIFHLVSGTGVPIFEVVFDMVSVATTTGYVSGNYDHWGHFGKSVLVVLMIVGGCSGSTAGGLKVGRIVLTARFVIAELRASFRPQELKQVRLGGRLLDVAGQGQLFLVIAMFGFFLIGGTLVMSSLEPETSFIGSLSAVLSCLSNVGPAFAEFGPRDNFAHLEPTGALVLSVLMILGRLEYLAVLVLFSRRLWRKY